MKSFLLGVISIISLNMTANYVWVNAERGTIKSVAWYVSHNILQGDYLLDPIMGNCKDIQGQNGFGWKFNVADYHRCDRFQRLLNGNLKPYKPGGKSL